MSHQVTEDEFFGKVGQLNVHPSIVSGWDDDYGYRSEWVMQDGSRRVVGVSDGGTTRQPNRYWLT